MKSLAFSLKYTIFSGLWAVILTIFTLYSNSRTLLNADVILNTIMSVQRVTLYYWGQNRLLNVLPLALSVIKDPETNLKAVLLVAGLSFFCLLLLFSFFSSKLMIPNNPGNLTFKTFLLVSSCSLCVLKPEDIYEISVGHIEYSLPALFLCAAFYFSFFKEKINIKNYILSLMLLFFSIGINPSTIIPAVFGIIALAFYKRKIIKPYFVFIFFALGSFFFWHFISKQHGNATYDHFDLLIALRGFKSIFKSIFAAINTTNTAVILICFLGIKILVDHSSNKISVSDNKRIVKYVRANTLIFAFGWMVVFASNKWVEVNQFSLRYFTYVVYILIFLTAISCASLLNNLSLKKSYLLTYSSCIFACLLTFSMPVQFNKYQIFQTADAYTAPGKHLYSGNYWVVWPSVMRDLILGYESYGLAYRGEGNREAASAYLFKKIEMDGRASVFCVDAETKECVKQIKSVVGPVYVAGTDMEGKGVTRINVTRYAKELVYERNLFFDLPSDVGVVKESARASDNRSGLLVYGPFAPMKAGKYRLVLFGTSWTVMGSYLDIASNGGQKIHGKFDLKSAIKDVLLDQSTIQLDEDVSDIEIRVWVNPDDQVSLWGYHFKPLL